MRDDAAKHRYLGELVVTVSAIAGVCCSEGCRAHNRAITANQEPPGQLRNFVPGTSQGDCFSTTERGGP
jgi:hypothetical protein